MTETGAKQEASLRLNSAALPQSGDVLPLWPHCTDASPALPTGIITGPSASTTAGLAMRGRAPACAHACLTAAGLGRRRCACVSTPHALACTGPWGATAYSELGLCLQNGP